MKIVSRVLAAMVFIAALPAVAAADPPSVHIDRALADFVRALNAGDAAGVASHYTEDAELLPPGSPPVVGREAIQGFWQGVIDAGITAESLGSVKVDAYGPVAVEVGQFVLNVPGENEQMGKMEGKYIVVWKRDGHTWRLHQDIYNVN